MTQHTQGPWCIAPMQSGRYAVDGANGEEITGWIRSEADAYLISSAPEMLAVLKLAESSIRAQVEANSQPNFLLAELQHVIAKAIGNCNSAKIG